MARRGVGSNQYRTRAVIPDAQAPAPDLMAQAAAMPTAKRREVAGNPHTSPQVLAQLAGDTDVLVRRRVAENPRTPPEVLGQLAGTDVVLARICVAENPHTSPQVLAQLAGDKDEDVREAALEHPNLPEEYRTLRQVTQ